MFQGEVMKTKTEGWESPLQELFQEQVACLAQGHTSSKVTELAMHGLRDSTMPNIYAYVFSYFQNYVLSLLNMSTKICPKKFLSVNIISPGQTPLLLTNS